MSNLTFDPTLVTFLGEAAEILQRLEDELDNLETSEQPTETIAALFRDAHTMKGSALVAGLRPIGELAHVLEELFTRWRDGRLVPRAPQLTWSRQALEMLRESLRLETETLEAATGGAKSNARGAQKATLKVDLEKLDSLAETIGELMLARGREQALVEELPLEVRSDLMTAFDASDRYYAELHEGSLRLRLVSFEALFSRLERAAEQVARKLGKRIAVRLEGQDLEVDATIVNNLSDPLMHIVRNAVDHGLELPDERAHADKPTAGTITIAARRSGGQVVVEVRDDGRGLNRDRIVAKAVERGRLQGNEVVTEQLLADLIFEPGFSTASQVTEVSGRGVGMDVVKSNVMALRGNIAVKTETGIGSAFIVTVPLALAIMQGFHVRVSGSCFVLPAESVERCVDAPPVNLVNDNKSKQACIRYGDRLVPLVALGTLLGLPNSTSSRSPTLLLRSGEEAVAFTVDALFGEKQTVVRPLGPMFHSIPAVSGATILGNGDVALLLDVPRVIEAARSWSSQRV